jgi:drug/metabolite transporter (DMT)-like permease
MPPPRAAARPALPPLTPWDIGELVLLAAIWGSSFMFLRVAAPAFGPVAVNVFRTGIAAVLLVALAAGSRARPASRAELGPLAVVGILNTAAPFVLYGYSALWVSAGFGALVNATTPLWAALVAYVWLRERLTRLGVLGLCIGFSGVVILVSGNVAADAHHFRLAVSAALCGSLLYGMGANYTRRYLIGVAPLTVAAMSLSAATLALLPGAILTWPEHALSARAWLYVLALGVVCTACGHLMYFRLIARIGPARAIAVTFLIPVFAALWGALFLHEPVTAGMVVGGAVILLGTALATGVIRAREPAGGPSL